MPDNADKLHISLLQQALDKINELNNTMIKMVTDVEHMKVDIIAHKEVQKVIADLSKMIYTASSNYDVMQNSIDAILENVDGWKETHKDIDERVRQLEKEIAKIKVTERIIWGVMGTIMLMIVGYIFSQIVGTGGL